MTTPALYSAAPLLAAALLLAPAAHAASCSLAELHWMQGVWRADDAKSKVEERWVVGPDDRLMGSSWVLHPSAGGGVVEAMTIQADPSGVALRIRHFSGDLTKAREEKDAPMLFTAASCDGASAVFDGQGPQAGEHITYRRDGARLVFVGDFIHQGQPVRAEVAFTSVRD